MALTTNHNFMKPDSIDNSLAGQFTVYWQPGCSSCLRAKEFLSSHGIEYKSVNVREDKTAMETLANLGARSIPVVTQDENFVFAQDIDVLAKFLGIELDRNMLPVDELVTRIDLILAAAQRYLVQLPDDVLTTNLPGRDRSYLDLGFHVFVIPLAFLDAIRGKELTYEHFERRPPEDILNTVDLVAFGKKVRLEIRGWWQSTVQVNMPETVFTYYGEHSSHSVLERTAWHTAQHVRQLMELLRHQGISPDGPLGDTELAGLPLPDEVYDDEVHLTKT